MGHRRTRALTALVLLTALGGCFLGSDGKYASTATDLDRAERAWRDPWLGAEVARVPTNTYGAVGVRRTVTDRDTSYAERHVVAARAEVVAATEHGWSLVAATCAAERTEATLTKGTGVDDGLRADVVVEEGSEVGRSIASVTGSVAHHADGSWPESSPTYAVAETCLGGDSGSDTPAAIGGLPDEPYDGPDADPDSDDFDGWQRDHLSDEESALRDWLTADPWVSLLGVDLGTPDLETGDSSRSAGARVGEVSTKARASREAVAEVVGEMTGWELTWASCGEFRATSTRLRLVSDAGVAVALLEASDDTGRVQWTITPPVPEGPRGDWVRELRPLADSRCLGGDPIRGQVIEGVPAVLPTSLQPIH